jgi:hypothetical protein
MHPEAAINGGRFRKVYQTLLSMPPTFSDLEINIESTVMEEEDDQPWIVYGTEYGTRVSYSLEWTPWQEWMSMAVSPDTIDLLGEIDTICHCLYELTLMGYTEEEIAQIHLDIMGALREYHEEEEEE